MDEKIKEAWDVGLNTLKPTPKELEHGLELHRDSLVIESYGFSPRAAMDGDAVAAAVEAGATGVELKDIRANCSMTRYGFVEAERKAYEAAWEHAGVTCILQNAGEEYNDPLTILLRLAHFTYASDLVRDFCYRAAHPDDIVAAKERGVHCIYMTGNAVPLAQQWRSVEEELRYVKIFFQLGMRMMHITYNRRTRIGDGCAEPANAGLSDFGRETVREMNRVGVIIDVAHSGFRTSMEAAQVSERPMVASHSGAHALSGHYRFKPDEVISAIADTDGYVGVCCVPRFLGGTGDLNTFLDHIEYIVKKFGAERVAIGTDVGYASPNTEAEAAKIPSYPAPRRKEWRTYWPNSDFTDPQWTKPEQRLSMAWTNWPLFTVGMVKRGMSDEDIRKVLGGNVLRVAKANWDQRVP